MAVANSTAAITLEELNREEVLRQIPLILYLIILSVLGTFGNILVLFVYRRNYPASNCRTFVIILSIVDVFSCLLVIPFEILVVLRQYNFRYAILCQISVFLNTWPTLTSGFLLVSIAADRYRKVCHPFNWQMSHAFTMKLCLANGAVAFAFSIIAPMVYGIKRSVISVDNVNITITQCSETDELAGTALAWFNNLSYAVLFFGALICMSVLYCLIAVSVKRHEQRLLYSESLSRSNSTNINTSCVVVQDKVRNEGDAMIKRRCSSDAIFLSECSETVIDKAGSKHDDGVKIQSPNCDTGPRVGATTLQTSPQVKGNLPADNSRDRKSIVEHILHVWQHRATSKSLSASSATSGSVLPRDSRAQKNDRRVLRTAYIMFLITLAFILSYLPLLTLLLVRTAIDGFPETLSTTGRAAYTFFLRSYFLNCAINPIIYGLWDSRFRKHSRRLFPCKCD